MERIEEIHDGLQVLICNQICQTLVRRFASRGFEPCSRQSHEQAAQRRLVNLAEKESIFWPFATVRTFPLVSLLPLPCISFTFL